MRTSAQIALSGASDPGGRPGAGPTISEADFGGRFLALDRGHVGGIPCEDLSVTSSTSASDVDLVLIIVPKLAVAHVRTLSNFPRRTIITPASVRDGREARHWPP